MSITLISVSVYIIAVIVIIIVLNLIQNYKTKKYKTILDNFEVEKNVIDSTPINSEISKIKTFLKNDKLDSNLNDWENRFKEIRTSQIPKITDMILEADYSLKQLDYKTTVYKIAKLEMELYKVRTNTDILLDEIKEITTSEERNRAIITKFKATYRELYDKFLSTKSEFGEITNSVILQFENISKRFEAFENFMENNDYNEVTKIIKSIDEMLKHMQLVLDEVPSIVLMATNIIPKKILEINEIYQKMTKDGYPLDYLNVEYNISEANKKISDIMDRTRVLNLEDSLFELKVLLDYFDSLYTDFEKEKNDRHIYDELISCFDKKLNKINTIVNEMFDSLDNIKLEYDLTEDNIKELNEIRDNLKKLTTDYEILKTHTSNNTFAFSKLIKEIENLTLKLNNIADKLDNTLETLGNIKEDEIRARQQLEEIKNILSDAKAKIKEFNFPILPQYYYVQLTEASDAIKEIVKELEKKPLSITILNTRVDTARDLVLKLYSCSKDLLKTAKFAEMAIVYGNRYRVLTKEIDNNLSYSEELFYNGEYKKSLEFTINCLNKVEPDIFDKISMNYN
ncbi:MAG TPA: septation ring formation regulator EzrA [Candidatus Faecisoma merdavium]|nr:septation ring formation regulator EzrA [Candidatus Faecisoma merdavium]